MEGRGIGSGNSARAVTRFVHGLQKYHYVKPYFQWKTALLSEHSCTNCTDVMTVPCFCR